MVKAQMAGGKGGAGAGGAVPFRVMAAGAIALGAVALLACGQARKGQVKGPEHKPQGCAMIVGQDSRSEYEACKRRTFYSCSGEKGAYAPDPAIREKLIEYTEWLFSGDIVIAGHIIDMEGMLGVMEKKGADTWALKQKLEGLKAEVLEVAPLGADGSVGKGFLCGEMTPEEQERYGKRLDGLTGEAKTLEARLAALKGEVQAQFEQAIGKRG